MWYMHILTWDAVECYKLTVSVKMELGLSSCGGYIGYVGRPREIGGEFYASTCWLK